MAADLDSLYQLQLIDDRLLAKQREIEIYERRLAERKAAMAACTDRIEELGRRRKQVVSDRAFAERRLSDLQDKLRDRKQRVSRVRTEKELHASQDEVASLREEIGNAETEVLTLMEQVDVVEAEIEAAHRDYKDHEEADHRDIAAEAERIEGLRGEAAGIRGERDAASAGVVPGLLKKYETVSGRRHGVAVVTVTDGRTCGGCHMQVPPQALLEIRRNSVLHACPNCQRILYIPSE